MRLFTISSSLHSEIEQDAAKEPFVLQVRQSVEGAGESFEFCGGDFARYRGTAEDVVYVRTGGTEGIFKSLFFGDKAVCTPGPFVRLLTSGRSNSLAASMEILSFLRQRGFRGEILHGEELGSAPAQGPSGLVRPISAHPELGLRLGVLGAPSDWLISSAVDYGRAREVLGVSLEDIPMTELLEAYSSRTQVPELGLKPLNAPRYGKPISSKSFEDALRLYGSLEDIIAQKGLDGLSLRCFDLLTAIGNTGCMGLSLLNSRGRIGTCEGDIPAMLSMAVARAVAGNSGFQVNLSQVRRGAQELLFAHCTVPLDIVEDYCYDTHFESGIGVAVHGTLPTGPATLLKIGPGLDAYVAEDVLVKANCYEDGLCRTQVLVGGRDAAHFDALSSYLTTEPLANHHILIPGHHAGAIRKLLG